MAKRLLGLEVTAALKERLQTQTKDLKERGILPKLTIIRVGENPADLSYERGAVKCAAQIGVQVEHVILPTDVSKEELVENIRRLNADPSVHGVLMFRPLPAHLKEYSTEICNALMAAKDVDCMTDLSAAGVFEDRADLGFSPCTAGACLEILDHYGINCEGKNVVVIGRSLVVGKPVAMMLLRRNATVTICHRGTKNIAEIARNADILITAAGALKSLTKEYVRPGQVVIDVSINWDENKLNRDGQRGAIAGDVVYEDVEPIVDAITPVPGGVGSVTVSILMRQVIMAARRLNAAR
ncbi:MAG: tetrahydrofolate dehydrogenase/cyclohydrolase catalytic domain-containing protein [Christensenellales bacterium]|nr:tetrahydrofolate dehydrogenase/cyclohydrolase catalytic domain-containing protein [Christensenellales bacterium]